MSEWVGLGGLLFLALFSIPILVLWFVGDIKLWLDKRSGKHERELKRLRLARRDADRLRRIQNGDWP